MQDILREVIINRKELAGSAQSRHHPQHDGPSGGISFGQ